jgi:ABC-2 type transport system permease protein
MTDLLAAEFLKLRTTRSFWILVAAALGFVALTTVATLVHQIPTDEDGARSLLSNVSIAGLFMLVVGAVDAAGEYRHKTITSAYLVAPVRARVLAAKSLAHAAAALLTALASIALALAISLPWLQSGGTSLGSLGLGGGELLGLLATMVVYVVLTAMLGIGLGALLTNQAAAVIALPVVLFVVDPIITSLVDGYGRWSIGGLWSPLTGGSSDDAGFATFSAIPAACIYFAYIAALSVIASLVDQRRDVS